MAGFKTFGKSSSKIWEIHSGSGIPAAGLRRKETSSQRPEVCSLSSAVNPRLDMFGQGFFID